MDLVLVEVITWSSFSSTEMIRLNDANKIAGSVALFIRTVCRRKFTPNNYSIRDHILMSMSCACIIIHAVGAGVWHFNENDEIHSEI